MGSVVSGWQKNVRLKMSGSEFSSFATHLFAIHLHVVILFENQSSNRPLQTVVRPSRLYFADHIGLESETQEKVLKNIGIAVGRFTSEKIEIATFMCLCYVFGKKCLVSTLPLLDGWLPSLAAFGNLHV